MSNAEEMLADVSKNTVSTNVELIKLAKALLIIIVILIMTNCATAIYGWTVFNSYEYETEVTTYQQDGDGVNSYNSGIMGDITNGADDNNN